VKACIVDASVAVKWFLDTKDEQLVSNAKALLDTHERGELQFMVPDLFWAEIGNIFWKAVRTGRCSRADAEKSLIVLQEGAWLTFPSYGLLNQAFQIALEFKRTVYDSLYVALASESGCELITADEKLINALAPDFPVKWLGAL
jgi:predicted nucleic acid-binding protein